MAKDLRTPVEDRELAHAVMEVLDWITDPGVVFDRVPERPGIVNVEVGNSIYPEMYFANSSAPTLPPETIATGFRPAP